MPPEKPTGYWLITIHYRGCSGYSTRPIKKHPADYMAENLEEAELVFAMPITKKQYAALRKAYAGEA